MEMSNSQIMFIFIRLYYINFKFSYFFRYRPLSIFKREYKHTQRHLCSQHLLHHRQGGPRGSGRHQRRTFAEHAEYVHADGGCEPVRVLAVQHGGRRSFTHQERDDQQPAESGLLVGHAHPGGCRKLVGCCH